MKRMWAASLALAVGSLLAGEAWAGPPTGSAPFRTPQVKRQDELIPLIPTRVVRGASAEPKGGTPYRARFLQVSHSTPAPEAPTKLPATLPTKVPTNGPPSVPTSGSPPGKVTTKEVNPPAVVQLPCPEKGEVVWAAPQCMAANNGPTLYASGEYLLWWIRNSNYPVLASTGPFRLNQPGDVSPFTGTGGVLGRPGTVVLFGGNVDNEERSGGRFTVGGWLSDDHKLGFEASGFFLGERSGRFQAASGDQLIARPFFNLGTNAEDVQTTALPGVTAGRLTIETPSQLCGFDANLQCLLCSSCCYRFKLLGGFRYLNLEEGLLLREDIALGNNVSDLFGDEFAFLNNANAVVVDNFNTRNQFYGGQVGMATQLRHNGWTLDMFTKVALGSTRQTIDIEGGQVIDSPLTGRETFRGGLLALTSNIGERSRDVFSVVPEVGVTVGRQLGSHVRLFAGYNFLFWSNVVRPGDQVDRNLNPFLIPNFTVDPDMIVNNNPGQRPVPSFRDTSFWAQGVNFGLELSF